MNQYKSWEGRETVALDIEEQYEKIYRYCFYRLRNREQAEDITQETFLRWVCQRHLPGYEPGASVSLHYRPQSLY